MNFDVVVVGSGPAGSAFARSYLEQRPDAHLAMVEAGPIVSSPRGSHVRNIADPAARLRAQARAQGPVSTEGPRTLDAEDGVTVRTRAGTFLLSDGMLAPGAPNGLPAASMSCNVGGMGAHWTCACPRPSGRERPEVVADDVFDALLDDAGRYLGVTQAAFDDSARAQRIRQVLSSAFPRAEDERPVQPMPLAIRREGGRIRWASADTILGERLTAERGIRLFAETLATRIELDGERVVGVTVRSRADGHEELLTTSRVFVAGDAFRTPQLLFASGIRPPALGRYLNDHADARCFVRLRDEIAGDDEGAAEVSGVTWIPYSEGRFPFSAQVMQLDAAPLQLSGLDPEDVSRVVGIAVFGTKEPRAEDRVWFTDDAADVFGMPAMGVEYGFTEADELTHRRLLATVAEIARPLGAYVGGEPAVLPPGGSYHFMGTVRMGDDPERSVCDSRSRVWGISGLQVGGNGVIPTPTAANPTVAAVALAIDAGRAAAEEA